MTKRKKSDINKPLSGDNHATQKDQRQKWPFWIGTGGRFQSESLAVFVGMRTQNGKNGYFAASEPILNINDLGFVQGELRIALAHKIPPDG
ncbi:MAG: hypothetical protein QF757_05500 [Candidatus Marinimicrobia bacterium]|nr:hypothetical protein [Candidatus Neomarinimicrobiota bacterium]